MTTTNGGHLRVRAQTQNGDSGRIVPVAIVPVTTQQGLVGGAGGQNNDGCCDRIMDRVPCSKN